MTEFTQPAAVGWNCATCGMWVLVEFTQPDHPAPTALKAEIRKAPVKGEIAPRGFYEEHSEKWKRQELLTAILDLQQALWSLQSRVELARQQADYGASHGKDAQDTLDAVLSALKRAEMASREG